MANIKIQVDEQPYSPMQYEPIVVSQQTQCNLSASQRSFKFNDMIGDFVIGYQYSHSLGLPAQTLRILGFSDTSVFINNSTGVETPASGFIPRRLKNTTTNAIINTFPYDMPIANLNQLGVEVLGTELICPSDMVNNTAKRMRDITYRLLDNNGSIGPVVTASFYNTP